MIISVLRGSFFITLRDYIVGKLLFNMGYLNGVVTEGGLNER